MLVRTPLNNVYSEPVLGRSYNWSASKKAAVVKALEGVALHELIYRSNGPNAGRLAIRVTLPKGIYQYHGNDEVDLSAKRDEWLAAKGGEIKASLMANGYIAANIEGHEWKSVKMPNSVYRRIDVVEFNVTVFARPLYRLEGAPDDPKIKLLMSKIIALATQDYDAYVIKGEPATVENSLHAAIKYVADGEGIGITFDDDTFECMAIDVEEFAASRAERRAFEDQIGVITITRNTGATVPAPWTVKVIYSKRLDFDRKQITKSEFTGTPTEAVMVVRAAIVAKDQLTVNAANAYLDLLNAALDEQLQANANAGGVTPPPTNW